MTVKRWIQVLCAMAIFCTATMIGANCLNMRWVFQDVTMPNIVKALRGQYEYSLKAVVELEAQNLARAVRGVDNRQEQYKIIEADTDYQRFFPNDEGYFFTYNMAGMRINVPVNKSSNYKDLSGLQDHNGVMIVHEFIKAVRAGGGFVEYHYDKPGAGIQPKLSYVAPIPGTDAFIGTGVYIDSVAANQKRIEDEVSSTTWKYNIYEISLGVLLLFVMIFLGFVIIHAICKPLTRLTREAESVAGGDLATDIHIAHGSPKEIFSLSGTLNKMVEIMRGRIREAAQRAEEASQATELAHKATEEAHAARAAAENAHREGMLAAAAKLENIVAALSEASSYLDKQIAASRQGADEAATRLAEAATAMNEMNATVREVAKNASSASQNSMETRDKAQEGARVVEMSMQSIEDVRNISRQLKDDMSVLNEHSQNITHIMSVISDIADQTNLLALNAAIEAARAGEAGRGFAVVADEVRKLAEKTMSSTSDVSSAITAIQQSTLKSTTSMDHAVVQVDKATELAGQSGQALKAIVTTIDDTADEVRGIAAASEQQSASSEEINRSIADVNSLTRDSVQTLHEAADSLSQLLQQVQVLTDMIREMKAS